MSGDTNEVEFSGKLIPLDMKDKVRIKFFLLVIILLISSGITVSSAKIPQIGDHVLIVSGDYTFLLIGNITSIDDNLIS